MDPVGLTGRWLPWPRHRHCPCPLAGQRDLGDGELQDGVRDIVGVPGRLACLSDRWWPEPGRGAGVSNFTAAACRIILIGRGLWRLRFRVQSLEAGGAGWQRAPPAVRWGGVGARPVRGEQLPARSMCSTVTRCIKLVRTLVGVIDPPRGRKNRGNSRVSVCVARVFGWVALGVGWVYCFLSRREGDSEELVTVGGQIPEIKTGIQ